MENMRGRGRGRRGRGRGRGVGGGRRKKSVDMKDENLMHQDEEEEQPPLEQNVIIEEQIVPKSMCSLLVDMEADISQLEAPTFTTLTRGPPEPMLRLRWGHPVNLLGEKVLNPMIHCCDQCLRPVLIYGRMIPCKHVFCLACAKRESKICPRCNEKVSRVEQTGLGTVFMCTHGGTRYGNTGCRRTYLSQRDLQAHINHRHVATPAIVDNLAQFPVQNTKVNELRNKTNPVQTPSPFYDKPKMYDDGDSIAYSSPRPTEVPPVPPAGVSRPTAPPTVPRSNLITVPLQEPPPPNPYYPSYTPGYYPPTAYQDFPPPTDTSVPPPPQPWPSNPQFYG